MIIVNEIVREIVTVLGLLQHFGRYVNLGGILFSEFKVSLAQLICASLT
jgi:hypothetical protein